MKKRAQIDILRKPSFPEVSPSFKRAQIDISFGMMFSIIIIIATIAVAAYAINYFLKLQNCTEIVGFYSELKDNVDKAYSSSFSNNLIELSTPGGAEEICFGNISKAGSGYPLEYKELGRLSGRNYNVYIYPSNQKCANSQPGYRLEKAEIREFFCASIISGKVKLRIVKEFNEPKARVDKA